MTEPSREALAKLAPVLTKRWLSPDAWQIDTYERLDGYAAVRKALDDDVLGDIDVPALDLLPVQRSVPETARVAPEGLRP